MRVAFRLLAKDQARRSEKILKSLRAITAVRNDSDTQMSDTQKLSDKLLDGTIAIIVRLLLSCKKMLNDFFAPKF